MNFSAHVDIFLGIFNGELSIFLFIIIEIGS